MDITEYKKHKIPNNSGVYFFKKGRQILYIGKATSLKDRTQSYFSSDLFKTRGPAILDMVTQANKITFQETESVLEALILESNLIKKHQPKYNVKEKDNKSYNFVIITKESVPKIKIIRERELKLYDQSKIKNNFGPFPSAQQLQIALKIIRKIFPYYDEKKPSRLNIQIGLIPDPEKLDVNEYKKNIKHVELFLTGKKKRVISSLKKDMADSARKLEFEKANVIKKQIYSLEHINDVALLDNSALKRIQDHHVESYDISHLSGKNNVGAMTVMINNHFQKKLYKKFKIKFSKNGDDLSALAEILERRFNHHEWKFPDFIVVDGGENHLKIAKKVIKKSGLKIPVVTVVKNNQHKPVKLLGDSNIINNFNDQILEINNETHRFVINFHRKQRSNNFLK